MPSTCPRQHRHQWGRLGPVRARPGWLVVPRDSMMVLGMWCGYEEALGLGTAIPVPWWTPDAASPSHSANWWVWGLGRAEWGLDPIT